MASGKSKIGILGFIAVVLLFAGMAYFSREPIKAIVTIHELLTENKELKQAIANLSEERQIGYAKVISQEEIDGVLYTTLRFVETSRDDNLKKILEKEYTIEGDIVHFDALIVKFEGQMVADGEARALYLWRRIYGEKMPPGQGFAIEEPGSEPVRYKDLLAALPIEDRELFWTQIWDLANDNKNLQQYGIDAIYGTAVYSKLTEGIVYIFRITPSGQVIQDIMPDI